MSLCQICSTLTLDSLVHTDPSSKKYGFKLADNLNEVRHRANTCALCKLVQSCIEAIPPLADNGNNDRAVWMSGIPASQPPDTKSLTGAIVACNGRSASLNLWENASPQTTIRGHAVALQVDSSQVADFIRTNEAACLTESHARCRQLLTGEPRVSTYAPPRLWSVKENKLEEDRHKLQDVSYTVLSYTWGRNRVVDPVKLLRSNKELRKQGVGISGQLPLLYQRAFEITRQLGEDFIWIDSLCIVQDDDSDRVDHFQSHVHQIYQYARVTICAIFDEPSSDILQNREIPSQDEMVDVINSKYCIAKRVGTPATDIGGENPLEKPYWATRGWTFQERVLASSCVFLTKHQLYWECHTSLVEEDGMTHLPIVYKRRTTSVQDFWPSMIRDYSNRMVRYDTDKIPAILGVAKQLSADPSSVVLQVGFMPQRLARDLLWESDGRQGTIPLTRRPEIEKLRVQSWSWAYWNGSVDFEHYLQNAELSAARYSVTSDGLLQVQDGKCVNLQGGAKMSSGYGGPTDIVYSVAHNNVLRLMTGTTQMADVGWGSFDLDPSRSGANIEEKKVTCLLVSTTTWTDSANKTRQAANVLLLNTTGQNHVVRAGVGQIWDIVSVDWQDLKKMVIGSFGNPSPRL